MSVYFDILSELLQLQCLTTSCIRLLDGFFYSTLVERGCAAYDASQICSWSTKGAVGGRLHPARLFQETAKGCTIFGKRRQHPRTCAIASPLAFAIIG